ncbi:MAG: citrate/2-methylcitrate synthase [Clostridia bacterium]|nr:citrate/2-methylcitrate synthase [Clostridia bacterium]
MSDFYNEDFEKIASDALSSLCDDYRKNYYIPPEMYGQYQVMRGLRYRSGSGVRAGLTKICNVHGYLINEGEKQPDDGRLVYRGIDINDFINGCVGENRYGFEEVGWLLLFGKLPNSNQLKNFTETLAVFRELPFHFSEDMILNAPSRNIMNKMARSVLALYSYDDDPDNCSLENMLLQSIKLIARMPHIMLHAYQAKRYNFDGKGMFFHPLNPEHNTAQSILYGMREDKTFTEEEARLLDLAMIIHAEHGGGNNSTFTTRVLSSSGTDTYSAISGALGSLKGAKHGGANMKVTEMMDEVKANVSDWKNEGEVADYITKILRKEAGDGSGLVYGMGHAIYTKSDPRAVILKKYAKNLAFEKGYGDEFELYEMVERLVPELFHREKKIAKSMCANVDFYSGLVYRSLGIPSELFTPLFAVARVVGWCAHRIEEVAFGGRIIRPAYKAIMPDQEYIPINQR